MRKYLGIFLVIISVYFFSWWGLLSIVIATVFIGWPDRNKGPFTTNKNRKDNALIYYKVGLIKYKECKYIDASDFFNKALELDPNETIFCIKGECLTREGLPELAIKHFNKAIEINPNFGYAYYGRSKAYHKLGNLIDAKKDKEKGVILNDDCEAFYFNMDDVDVINDEMKKDFDSMQDDEEEKLGSSIQKATELAMTDGKLLNLCNKYCSNSLSSSILCSEILMQKINVLSFFISRNYHGKYSWATYDFFTENVGKGLDSESLLKTTLKRIDQISKISGEGPKRVSRLYENSVNYVLRYEPTLDVDAVTAFIEDNIKEYTSELEERSLT